MTGGNVTFKFSANTTGFVKGVKKAKGVIFSFSKILNGLRRMLNRSISGLFKMHAHMLSIYGLFRGFSTVFRQSFAAVENFNAFIAQTGAIITSFSGVSLENIPKVFKASTKYAEDLRSEFLKINAQTLATVEQMQLVNRELNKGGVILKLNKKSMEGFADVTNAIAVLTAGMPDQARQFSQEMRSVMEGRARAGSTLALLLKGKLGQGWRDEVKKWKEQGKFIEKMGETFSGFRQAAPMMSQTWQAVGSTFKSMGQEVLRLGFVDLFNEIIIKVKSINKYLEENRKEISDLFKKAWKPFVDSLQSFDLEKVLKKMGSKSIKNMAINIGLIIGEAMYNGIRKSMLNQAMKKGKVGMFAQMFLVTSEDEKKLIEEMTSLSKKLEWQKKLNAEAAEGIKLNKKFKKEAEALNDGLIKTGKLKLIDLSMGLDNAKLANTAAKIKEMSAGIQAYKNTLLGMNEEAGFGTGEGLGEVGEDTTTPVDPLKGSMPGGADDMGEGPYGGFGTLQAYSEALREELPIIEQIFNEMEAIIQESMESINKSIKSGIIDGLSSMMREANNMPEIWESIWQSIVKTVTDAVAAMIVEFLLLAAAKAFAGIPPGPSIQSAAANAAGVNLPGMATGTMNVPMDMPAMLHRGESVIPKTFTDGLKNGTMTMGNNEAMIKKLDQLIEVSAQNKYAIVDDDQLPSLTKAINNTNYNLSYMGV